MLIYLLKKIHTMRTTQISSRACYYRKLIWSETSFRTIIMWWLNNMGSKYLASFLARMKKRVFKWENLQKLRYMWWNTWPLVSTFGSYILFSNISYICLSDMFPILGVKSSLPYTSYVGDSLIDTSIVRILCWLWETITLG